MFKRCVLFLIAIALTLMSGLAWASDNSFFKWLDKEIEKKEYSTQENIRHVRIAGIDLWIPKNYNMGSYDNNEFDQQSVLLQLLLPNFEPRTEKNIKEFIEGRGHGDRMQILLNDFAQTTDINYRYKKSVEMSAPHEPMENLYGFDEAFRSVHPDQVIMGAEFYVKRDDQNIKTYIRCRIGRTVKNQGCQHHLVYKNLLLSVTYSSRYLPDWKAIEVKAVALMQRLSTKPSEGEPLTRYD